MEIRNPASTDTICRWMFSVVFIRGLDDLLLKMKAAATARLCPVREVLPLRTRYRQEMNCQIVHDSIHQRPGWMLCYALEVEGGAVAGFGSIAIAGPWKDKPTVSEFYLLPEYRLRAF